VDIKETINYTTSQFPNDEVVFNLQLNRVDKDIINAIKCLTK